MYNKRACIIIITIIIIVRVKDFLTYSAPILYEDRFNVELGIFPVGGDSLALAHTGNGYFKRNKLIVRLKRRFING